MIGEDEEAVAGIEDDGRTRPIKFKSTDIPSNPAFCAGCIEGIEGNNGVHLTGMTPRKNNQLGIREKRRETTRET